MNYLDIQKEVIEQYKITIEENSKCWGRMHAHIRERKVCKWHSKNSVVATFDLLHEVGHIENNASWMRRCEEEYYATDWAVMMCKKYGIKIPEKIRERYQKYIDMELERGKRRGGTNYKKNLVLSWD